MNISIKRGLCITRIWADDDMVELAISVADGQSYFVNQVYVGYAQLSYTIDRLQAFRSQIHGGLLDVCFGNFGCEYANGAFHARFHFSSADRLYVSCRQESAFEEFGIKTVASHASMYLVTEPILLDRFIGELGRIPIDAEGAAYLEAV